MSVAKASSVANMSPEMFQNVTPFIDTNKGVLMLLRDTPID